MTVFLSLSLYLSFCLCLCLCLCLFLSHSAKSGLVWIGINQCSVRNRFDAWRENPRPIAEKRRIHQVSSLCCMLGGRWLDLGLCLLIVGLGVAGSRGLGLVCTSSLCLVTVVLLGFGWRVQGTEFLLTLLWRIYFFSLLLVWLPLVSCVWSDSDPFLASLTRFLRLALLCPGKGVGVRVRVRVGTANAVVAGASVSVYS